MTSQIRDVSGSTRRLVHDMYVKKLDHTATDWSLIERTHSILNWNCSLMSPLSNHSVWALRKSLFIIHGLCLSLGHQNAYTLLTINKLRIIERGGLVRPDVHLASLRLLWEMCWFYCLSPLTVLLNSLFIKFHGNLILIYTEWNSNINFVGFVEFSQWYCSQCQAIMVYINHG